MREYRWSERRPLWLVVERERVGFADATSLHSSGAERFVRQKSGTRATLIPKVMRSVLAFLLASSASALQLSSPKALLHKYKKEF